MRLHLPHDSPLAIRGAVWTPEKVAAYFGASTWAHWPLHPALPGTSLATVVAPGAPTNLASWVGTQLGVQHSAGRMTGDGLSNKHYVQHLAAFSTLQISRGRIRVKPVGAQQWVTFSSCGATVSFDIINGVVGASEGTFGVKTITPAGGGWMDLEVQGYRSAPTYNWLVLNNTDNPYSTTWTCPADQGVDYALIPGDTGYYSATSIQSIGDEGPRGAHLVQSTPASQPEYNAWDANGSQGGTAGARRPSGFGRHAIAIDAVLGTIPNGAGYCYVTWEISSLGSVTGYRRGLYWRDSSGVQEDTPLTYYSGTWSHNRSGVGNAVWSSAPNTGLVSRVIAASASGSTMYTNGAMTATAPALGGTVTTDRVYLFHLSNSSEHLWLGGGVFAFASDAAMNAALPAIHAMVARMRAIWGIS